MACAAKYADKYAQRETYVSKVLMNELVNSKSESSPATTFNHSYVGACIAGRSRHALLTESHQEAGGVEGHDNRVDDQARSP